MPNFPRILYYLTVAMRRLKWDHEKLRNYQEKRLRQIVKYAYTHVPFYHNKFKEAGIRPRDVRTVKDLAKVPITRKDELRSQTQDRLISTEFSLRDLKVVTTSGSTGKPLNVYIAGSEDDWRKAIYMRANIFCGQKPRDRWVVITSPRHFGDTTRLQRVLGIYAQTCISVFDDVGTQISKIRRVKPDVLDGYSSAILLLAKEVEKIGQKIVEPRIVFGNAEIIDAPSLRYVMEVFNAPYCDQYGCVEFNRTAWQCLERMGYHMDVDSVITQFVDEEGNEVTLGENGEIVQTSMFNYAMPFIRYEVGDVGVRSDEECRCGIALPLMKVVEGRKDSLIALPDGRMLSPRTITVAMSMFKHYDSIEQYRIVQKRLDFLEVLIKVRDNNVDKKIIETDLVTHFNRMVHFDEQRMTLDVKFVEDIALSKSGKIMAVVSELGTNIKI